jgi:hypothetical protein
MDKIQLDTRDRRNLYREDSENVFAVGISSDEPAVELIGDVVETLTDAIDTLRQTGGRFAYVVMRIER